MQIKNRNILGVSLVVILLSLMNAAGSFANELLGGLAFTGERKGVCVLIEGEFIESIYFKLDTCDENQVVKEEFKNRTPFTLVVPKGLHRLVIMKEGHKVVSKMIEIVPEETLYFKLPEEFDQR